MKTFTAVQLSILWITLRYSYAVNHIGCNATVSLAGNALDLINKGRSNDLLFQLLWVTDTHLDRAESTDVYYFVLEVKESNCPVQYRIHWDDCEPNISRYPPDIVNRITHPEPPPLYQNQNYATREYHKVAVVSACADA
ncbi:Histidine-rich glycoprotein [Myotis davidii]|uniref:Histidine-rich glycoprotein n=1 Tax=Myotis davidii TaxID=225400 RepID=L5MJK9_MYODS|nr:Histidine-rich glycoprotein [Myotis davidii]